MSSNNQAAEIGREISQAFSARLKPVRLTDAEELDESDRDAIRQASLLDWRDTDAEFWERNFELLSFLSPSAFCYYLPGMMVAAMEVGAQGIVVAHHLLSMLDRTPDPELWDDRFIARWCNLNRGELHAVVQWIDFLFNGECSILDETSQIRMMLTLDQLISRCP